MIRAATIIKSKKRTDLNKQPLNVLFIGPAYPYRGGIASFIHRLAEEFEDNDHQVKINTFTFQYPDFLFPGTSQYSDGPNPTSIPIERMIHSVNPLNWLKVGRKVKKEKPDIVICKFWLPLLGPCYGSILRLIKRNKHTKVVCIVDNIIPHEKRIMDRQFAQYFANAVDAFVVMSESVRADLKKFVKDQKVKLILHPIYDNYGDPVQKGESINKLGLEPDFSYLLFFGFIRKYKGLDLLIDAMNHPYFSENNIKLLIAGEYYDDSPYYKQKIGQLKDPGVIVEHTKFIPDGEVKYYFGACDLVVQPYRSATQSGISQLAIFFEKPMVVTDVGGLPEIIGHEKGGYVVEPTASSIRDALIRFFEKKDQSQFVNHICQQKKLFSWQNFYTGILELIS